MEIWTGWGDIGGQGDENRAVEGWRWMWNWIVKGDWSLESPGAILHDIENRDVLCVRDIARRILETK